jgi:hypothetical protein
VLCQLEPLGMFEPLPLLARCVFTSSKSETPETIIKNLELHQKSLIDFEGLSVCLVGAS